MKNINRNRLHNHTLHQVRKVLKSLKVSKSQGLDDVYPECMKLIDANYVNILVDRFNKIYDARKLLSDWLKSTFILIYHKKSKTNKWDQVLIISLMSQNLKLFLKIIHNRVRRKCELDLSETQIGFRVGLRTREALFDFFYKNAGTKGRMFTFVSKTTLRLLIVSSTQN